jgi:predicted nucleotidyltransferase component of viral defense system
LDLIKKLSQDEFLQDFTLVGGTALALQIGHRISVDIDLFSKKSFDSMEVAEHLKQNYPAQNIVTAKEINNVAGFISDVKVTLIAHEYNDVSVPIVEQGIKMASLDDIAAMKIHAIHNSGTRYKDFVDIYHLLEHRSMNEMLKSYMAKYPDMNEITAKMALGNHDEVKTKSKIEHLRRDLTWPEISDRIQWALKQPGQKFKAALRKKRPDEPNQRLRRKRGRGH